jgi:hypothetical protein
VPTWSTALSPDPLNGDLDADDSMLKPNTGPSVGIPINQLAATSTTSTTNILFTKWLVQNTFEIISGLIHLT